MSGRGPDRVRQEEATGPRRAQQPARRRSLESRPERGQVEEYRQNNPTAGRLQNRLRRPRTDEPAVPDPGRPRFAIGVAEGKKIQIWDLTGEPKKLHEFAGVSLAISPDAKIVLRSGPGFEPELADAETGALRKTLPYRVYQSAFRSPDVLVGVRWGQDDMPPKPKRLMISEYTTATGKETSTSTCRTRSGWTCSWGSPTDRRWPSETGRRGRSRSGTSRPGSSRANSYSPTRSPAAAGRTSGSARTGSG